MQAENLGGYLIREQINKTDDNKASLADVRRLNLQRLVQAEVTSENPEYPVDWRGCRDGGKARTRGKSGPSVFSIELAGRYKGVKLQIVAIDKFALESHVVSRAQTAETLYVDRTSAVWKRYGNYLP